MRRLIIVAHPDDEVLGFGGAGSYYSQQGDKILPIILCGKVSARNKRPKTKQPLEDTINASKIISFQKPIIGDFPNLEMNAVPHIKLVKFIEENIKDFEPDFIYTHHPSDLNDDHVQVSKACMAASRLFQRNEKIKRIKGVYYMEILSSTEWSLNPSNYFTPNYFVNIENTLIKKLDALNCYRDVMRKNPHPRSEECIKSLSIFRGSQSGYKNAEAFQVAFQTD